MPKTLNDIETDQVYLLVVECDCGYHMTFDAIYVDQCGDVFQTCPNCGLEIDSSINYIVHTDTSAIWMTDKERLDLASAATARVRRNDPASKLIDRGKEIDREVNAK